MYEENGLFFDAISSRTILQNCMPSLDGIYFAQSVSLFFTAHVHSRQMLSGNFVARDAVSCRQTQQMTQSRQALFQNGKVSDARRIIHCRKQRTRLTS